VWHFVPSCFIASQWSGASESGKDLIVDGWFHERGILWPGQAMSIQVEEILDHHRSKFQDVLVFKSKTYGTVLVLDGVIQCTERDEFSYQEMISHVPLCSHANPEKVLVIGGGDGGVLREIAKHDCVKEIVICEIDADVIDVSKKYLPGLAAGFNDPRVTVVVDDGAVFLENNKNTYDVIITDSSDPVGPASVLFETPFYTAMFKSLREGGIVFTQGECIWLHLQLIRPLIAQISKFFTTVEYAYTTMPTYPSGQIGFICGTKNGKSCKKPVRQLPPEVLNTLQYYSPELHEACFVLPAFARRAILE
jgi:spermidine synthase